MFREKTIYEKVAFFSFMVFLFFSFFGTATPFRQQVTDVEDITSSNIINQVLYTYLFLAALFALLPMYSILGAFFRKEKFLSIFIIFVTLSLAWSDNTLVSVKRIVQLYAELLICLAFIMHAKSDEEMLEYFKPILYIFILATITVCLTIPGAKDAQFNTWRGFTTQKNDLGELGLVCVLLTFFIYKREETFLSRLVAGTMVLLSVVIVVGTFSSTCLITLTLLIGIGSLWSIDKIFKPIGINRAVTSLVIFSIIGFILLVILLAPDLLDLLPTVFGKDTTFSGRTDLWVYMMDELQRHLLLGVGYQGFWVVGSQRIVLLYKQFVWLPNQAHNGYIDVVNELGLVGFGLFLLMIISYFVNLARYKIHSIWKWFIIIALILNLQETTFLRPGKLINSLIIFSYIVLAVKMYRKDLEPATE